MNRLSFPYNLFRVGEGDPMGVDAIAALDYGVTVAHNNTPATNGSITEAIHLQRRFQNAKIVFGTSSHCFPGSDKVSTAQKVQQIEKWGISSDDYLYAGGIKNTVLEAVAIRRALRKANIRPRFLVVYCDQMHSRDVRYIYRRVFKGTKIVIRHITQNAWHLAHIFADQSTIDQWALSNLKRFVALRLLGLKWTAHHGVRKA